MLHYSSKQIVLQEVPDEISLALSISGCKLACKGCHSTETWNPKYGSELTENILQDLITRSKYITCVLFYGGEWQEDYLITLLNIVKQNNLKTCLYTGLELNQISNNLLSNLTYIKTGRYMKELGGLESKTTNQKFIKISELEKKWIIKL